MKKMSKRKRRRRCDVCRELKGTSRRREDPYSKEINNKTVERVFCDECYQEALWAI